MGKVLVSMPDDLLEEVDREAAARGTSRSGLLQQAVRRELEHSSKVVIEEALSRGRQALSIAGAFESADLIRRERRSRDAADRSR